MRSNFKLLLNINLLFFCMASYHEQYRVPHASTDTWESYVFDNREYLLQNLPVSWENANILCRGQYNATLAILDTKEKAEFMAEALSESQLFSVESTWVGARRASADDPAGYRWSHGVELRRTSLDVLGGESDVAHYPSWLNRTHVPVPEDGADCVALERVYHDRPVFVDLPCTLGRAFVCEREAPVETPVTELRTVRCRTGLYRMYGGRLNWHQAASYCVLRKMTLATIASMRCLKKLGMSMLKTRPSMENAWVGGHGQLGHWTWLDSGLSVFQPSPYLDVAPDTWPPMRDRNAVKQNGCLQLDRHAKHPPVFMEARCDRKMQFICYQSAPSLRSTTLPPSDDNYYYVLVRQQLYWQHAFDNCQRMNGTLATVDNNDLLVQLLLVMGENKEEPVDHIWLSGRLNMTKDPLSAGVAYSWINPATGRRIPDSSYVEAIAAGLYMPPWLDEDFTMDSPCLNLDREDHLTGLVYGMPCDTAQPSICIIEKSSKTAAHELAPMPLPALLSPLQVLPPAPSNLSAENVGATNMNMMEE